MKILIYSLNYEPEITGIGRYTGEMAEWLAAQGHELCVVTAPPYYPEWKVGEGYSGWRYMRERINGVEVWRCPLYVPESPSGLKRIVHLASFALSSLPVMLRHVFWKPDIVFVVEPPLFCAPSAWMTARLAGGKCWLHVQDFEVDAAFDLGIIPFGWMKRLVLSMEHALMKRFDVVSTISRSMMRRLHEKGIANPVFFPNWSDSSRICHDKTAGQAFRAELGLPPEACMCLYSGNIAVKQGLEILLDAARMLPDCEFVICGDGANKKALQAAVKRAALKNLRFLPLQPVQKLAALLSAADIHLVIQRAGAADLVMPSKLTNILAVGGVAVVTAAPESELGRMAEGDQACVYRCDPEDPDALVRAITALRDQPELAESLRRRAKDFAERFFGQQQVLGDFESQLKQVCID